MIVEVTLPELDIFDSVDVQAMMLAHREERKRD